MCPQNICMVLPWNIVGIIQVDPTSLLLSNRQQMEKYYQYITSSSPPVSPRFFPALSLALFFARAPLSERLEQANLTVKGHAQIS